MHRIRQASAVLSALALSVALAACSPATDEPADPDACTLAFLASADRPTAEQDAYKEVFADFENEYNCHVDTTFEGTWDQITQQLTAARLAGTQVNLFITSTATRDLAKAGLTMDLSGCIAPFQDRFVDSAMAPYTIGERNWAVPLSSTDTSAIIYNADMFEELGIAPPETYAELVAAGETIAEAKGIVPMIHQGKSPWYWPMWYMASFAQTSGNRSVEYTEDFLSGNRSFASSEEEAALAALADFTADGLLDRATLDTDEQGMYATFLQQKAAMFFALTPSLINISDSEPDFTVGVLQFPRITTDPQVLPQVGGGPENGLAVASFAPESTKEASCQLVEFMSRPDVAAKLMAPTNPLVPSVVGVPATASEPLAPQLTAEFIPNTIPFLDWIWPAPVNDAVTTAITDVMYADTSPQEAAQSVQAALDKVRAEEDYTFDWWSTWSEDDWARVSFPHDMSIEVGEG
ncbi:MAG: ABC transporter substrate-binding protein [Propioniciclava sp.]